MPEEFGDTRDALPKLPRTASNALASPRVRLALLGGGILIFFAFSAYLFILYQQLNATFSQQEQFLPTRIYSDVSRIASPQIRSTIEERLKALGYSPAGSGEDKLIFTLHPIEYPFYLVPDNHLTLGLADQPITLSFDGPTPESLLRSIEVGGKEIPDIYLEPELVATFARGTREIRNVVEFEKIPALVWQAIIAIEDQHFLEHKGLDPRGIARAIWVNIRTHSFAQGGSTITQQLVKNLMARRTKNLVRKVNELFLALLLEAKWGKEKILERYLNEVYLGQVGSLEIHGVSEGAKHFFGKRLDELNLAEMAMMAGLIRGPGYYSPYRYRDRAIERQKLVLKKMVETGQIAEEEAQAALAEPIRLAPPQGSANKAPYFTDFVRAELIRHLKDKMTEQEITQAGFRVYTTLDMAMNSAAQATVSKGIADLEKKYKIEAPDRLEGALASVDHSNGFIRALIGGRSYAQSTFNRILNMKRQVGSTFKPFVYLTAFEKGEDPRGVPYGPGYPVEDAAWTLIYDHKRQTWTPKNYEKEFMGWVTMRKALAHSINTVAARVGYEVRIENIVKTARALGIESDLPNVPSLSLGVAELSPVDLLRAYAVMANHGVQDELTVIRGILENNGSGYSRFVYHPKQVFDSGPVDLMTDMMQSVFTEGTAISALAMGFDRPAAGKTGTTSHHRDSWFAGYTPQLTTVVWVGMDQAPIQTEKEEEGPDQDKKLKKISLTGAGAALPIWVSYMKKALAGEPPAQFSVSPYLSNVQIDHRSGQLASFECPSSQVVVEKYVKGHEPKMRTCETLWPTSIPETMGN